MRPKLIILSDLWGYGTADWQHAYIKFLSPKYRISLYDATYLGEIDTSSHSEDIIHKQFVNGGIDRAVENLLAKNDEPAIIIGCSVGGVIAWKAGLKGLICPRLIAISATRLRYEIDKPFFPIELYYGGLDKYKPDNDWFERINIHPEILAQGNHDIYKEPSYIEYFLRNI